MALTSALFEHGLQNDVDADKPSSSSSSSSSSSLLAHLIDLDLHLPREHGLGPERGIHRDLAVQARIQHRPRDPVFPRHLREYPNDGSEFSDPWAKIA
jgi:hypothetical protein